MGWFQIIKTEWDFKLKPNYKKYNFREDRKPRGEYFRDEDKVEINLLENLPSNWSSWKDGKKVVDYDKEPHEKTEWGGKLRGDLDRDTISNVLDVIIHEAGHAGIDRFLEEEGFPEDEKDEFINKWQKQAKLQVWSEIMAELNEHGGDLPQAIDSARRLHTYNRHVGGAKNPFQKRLRQYWNDLQEKIIDKFEQQVELGLVDEEGYWTDLRYPHKGHQHDTGSY